MDLFRYEDYRAYLRDFYEAQKVKNRSYSYRVFANRAKLGSPNYLKLVIDGTRRITEKNLSSFIRGLGLEGDEVEYFRALVQFQDSDDEQAKRAALAEIYQKRELRLRQTLTIEEDRREIMRQWYHFAIRELVTLKDFDPDPKWISARFDFKVTPSQAEQSLKLLERLRFIEFKNGKYQQTDPLISTTDEVSCHLLRQLHRQLLEKASEALFSHGVSEREIAGLVLAIPKTSVPKVKAMIKEFILKINQQFSEESGNEEVYTLGVQFFPVTKPINPEGEGK